MLGGGEVSLVDVLPVVLVVKEIVVVVVQDTLPGLVHLELLLGRGC